MVIKPEHLDLFHNVLNRFDKNQEFIVGIFDDVVPHFLNTEIHPDGLGINFKPTNTGQYIYYTSFSLWKYKRAWFSNIVLRAIPICVKEKLQIELTEFKILLRGMVFQNG